MRVSFGGVALRDSNCHAAPATKHRQLYPMLISVGAFPHAAKPVVSEAAGDSRHAGVAINPLVFPEPQDKGRWATRAIRGERRWLEARPLDGSVLIQGMGSAALVAGGYAAYRRRLAPTVASAAVVILCNAWFLDRMANTYGRSGEDPR